MVLSARRSDVCFNGDHRDFWNSSAREGGYSGSNAGRCSSEFLGSGTSQII